MSLALESRPLRWGLALVCSLGLTLLTVLPPMLPGDWARLNADGIYTPTVTRYAWPAYGLQIALWLGILLPVLSLARWTPRVRRRTFSRRAGVIVAFTLLGFGLRLHHLAQLPLVIDEIGFAARASDLLHFTPIPIFAPAHNGNPAAFSWLMAGSMALWGQTRFAMRLIALAAGVLTIPAAARLGDVWWGRKTGWMAAAVVAVYPAHVHFSQLALYNICDPLLAMMALTALKIALAPHVPRRDSLLLAGLLAGVTQGFYHGSRLMILLFGLYLLHTALSRRWNWRIVVRAAFDLSAPFVLISLPRFAPLLTGGLPLTGNLEGVRLPPDVWQNALRSLLAWIGQPDISPFWLSSQPLLPLAFLVPFLAGCFLCLRRWRQPDSVLLLLTLLLTTLAGGVIWAAAPLYVRYLTALPAVVLLITRPLSAGGLRRSAPLFIGLMLLQGVIVSVQHSREGLANTRPGLWEADRIAQQAAALPAGTALIVSVSADFSAVERITIADWVAAYGLRRGVRVEQTP